MNELQKLRVLIVEDDQETRELLRVALELEGYQPCIPAESMPLIVQLEQEPPDVVLLDVMMGWSDGYELCRAIKTHPALCKIPVMFISGMSSSEDFRKGQEAGAADYLTKPFTLEILHQKIRGLLPKTL